MLVKFHSKVVCDSAFLRILLIILEDSEEERLTESDADNEHEDGDDEYEIGDRSQQEKSRKSASKKKDYPLRKRSMNINYSGYFAPGERARQPDNDLDKLLFPTQANASKRRKKRNKKAESVSYSYSSTNSN